MKKFILISLALMLVASIFADVTIGEDTNLRRTPFGVLWGYERSAAIYTAAEINLTGTITHLGWNVGTAQSTNVPLKIYLTTTTNSSLTATTWASLTTGVSPVFIGTIPFSATGWAQLDIIDFNYNHQTSGNLLVLCETAYGGTGTFAYSSFFYSDATAMHQDWHADNDPPTGNGELNQYRPNITLYGISTPLISSFPFVESFESGITDQSTTIANWTQTTGPDYFGAYWTANSTATTFNRTPRTGAWNASLRYDGQSMLSRPIELTAGTEYTVELFARQDTDVATDATIAVSYSLDGVSAGDIIAQTGVINGDYQRFYGTFTPATAGIHSINIHGWVNHYPWFISLDDITIDLATPILSITPRSIDFGAMPVNTQSTYQNVTVSNDGSGTLNLTTANLGLFGLYADQFVCDTSALPVALRAGQSVNLLVRFAPSSAGIRTAVLRISYDGGDYDVNLSGNAISENALFEGFEAGVIPDNWTVINADGNPEVWNAQIMSPHSGTYSARVRYESNDLNNDDWLITPPLKLSTTTTDTISFWMRSNSYNDEGWEVLISTTDNDPASFTMIDSGSGLMYQYAQQSYNLDSYGDAIVYLAVRYVGSESWYMMVDDFVGPEIYVAPYSIVGLTGKATLPNNASLSWRGVYGRPGEPGYLNWDDGVPRGAAISGGGTYHAVSKFGTEITASAAGMQLKSVKIHINEAPESVVALKVWTGDDTFAAPTALIYEQVVSGLSIGWNNVVLSSTVSVDGNSAFYVGFEIDGDSNTALTVSIDGLSGASGRGNLLQGASWTSLSNAGVIGNWLIHPYFGNAAIIAGRQFASVPAIPFANKVNNDRAVLGFNIYREGDLVNPSPISTYSYIDEDLAPGTYEYTIQALLEYANDSLCSTISVEIPTPLPSISLPFTEDWSSGDFATNNWTAGSNNWRTDTLTGDPAPSVAFSWLPRVFDYSTPLSSYYFDATGLNSVQFSFDLNLVNRTSGVENYLTWDIWDGSTWNNLGAYNSLSGDLPWTHYSHDVSTFASSGDFRIRFVAAGLDSHGIDSWFIDNITIGELPPLALPFSEDWSSGSFGANKWTAGSENWMVGDDTAKDISEPSATFSWSPQVLNYNIPLSSHELDATGINRVQLSFYLNLDNYSTDAENVMSWEIWNGSSWNSLGSYSSLNGDLDWTYYSYDVSAYASNRIFKIRFVASGEDSYEMDFWYIDNIELSELTPIALPFLEDWASGEFATNQWTAGSENWISDQYVGTSGINFCTSFLPEPQQEDFSIALDSYYFDATGIDSVQLSFDLDMVGSSNPDLNLLSWQIWDGSTWNTLDSYSSMLDGWTRLTYDVSAYASNRIFRIRFVASGANSSDIIFWGIANIELVEWVTSEEPITDLNISQGSGQMPEDFLLQWTAVPTADWYLVYISDDPYSGFVPLQISHYESLYLMAHTLPQDKAFFKVTAGTGPEPTVSNNPPAKK